MHQVYESISRVNVRRDVESLAGRCTVTCRVGRPQGAFWPAWAYGSTRMKALFLFFPQNGRLERFLKIPKAIHQEHPGGSNPWSESFLTLDPRLAETKTRICQVSRSVWKHSRFKVEETWNHKAPKKDVIPWCWAYFPRLIPNPWSWRQAREGAGRHWLVAGAKWSITGGFYFFHQFLHFLRYFLHGPSWHDIFQI